MEPFLRWAGGKTWLKKLIINYLPESYINYHEPFLGGGSIFFYINHDRKSYLSDVNKELIYTYIQVRDNVDEVIQFLKQFKNTEKEYYRIRSLKFENSYQKAAQFIYLNMTSFNGIYRVSRKGVYNVPYGHRNTIDFIQEENLRLTSRKLKASDINNSDFEAAIKLVKKDDFVFLDPPYTVAHAKNGFIGYNQKLFSLDDQYRLAECLRHLNKIGANFVLTNAFHDKIKEIYEDTGNFIPLTRMSLIGGKGAKRQYIKEYLIKNFQ